MNDVIVLISQKAIQDDVGNFEISEIENEIFCKIKSSSRSEFFEAAKEGFKAEIKAEIWEQEYNGETVARIGNKTFNIYRTYKVNEYKRELYLSEMKKQ